MSHRSDLKIRAVWMVLMTLAMVWVLLALGVGVSPSEESVQFERLQPGMAKAEVVAIVGQYCAVRTWETPVADKPRIGVDLLGQTLAIAAGGSIAVVETETGAEMWRCELPE